MSDAAHVAVPEAPPAATADAVRAELRADAAASRMIRTERWSAPDGVGVVHADPVPLAETERALTERPVRETPKAPPVFQQMIARDDETVPAYLRGARFRRYR